MTYLEYWFIFAACVFGWITWDTRRAPLAFYTQWKMKLDDDLALRRRCFESLEIRSVTWARDAEDFEAWCRYVDLIMIEEGISA